MLKATPGVLYFLDENEKLPLHTDHAGFNDKQHLMVTLKLMGSCLNI